MNITDGRYTYFRSPTADNRPLNVYTTMPTDIRRYYDAQRLQNIDKITCGRYLSWTDYPVYWIPADCVRDNDDGTLRFVYLYDWEQEDQLYDLQNDYGQLYNLAEEEPRLTAHFVEKMREALRLHDAPSEQYRRMRL